MFLVMQIRFVEVYSGNVNKWDFLVQTGFFGYILGGLFGLCRGVFWYKTGGALVGTKISRRSRIKISCDAHLFVGEIVRLRH